MDVNDNQANKQTTKQTTKRKRNTRGFMRFSNQCNPCILGTHKHSIHNQLEYLQELQLLSSSAPTQTLKTTHNFQNNKGKP